MHRLLWVGQVLFGVYFVVIGVLHFVVPDDLPAQMAWMHDLSTTLHLVAGTAEILGGLGLILPGLVRVKPGLTPLAAACLAGVMVAAAAWHVPRGEWPQVGLTLLNATILAGLAYGRWRVRPLEARPRTAAPPPREPTFT